MITIVTYDITDPKRLTRTHKFMKNYGVGVQKSVFECPASNIDIADIKRWCEKNLDLSKDSVGIYRVCGACIKKAKTSGIGVSLTQLDYVVL